MKLLYLYIQDHNCIKKQEFNFDSKYRFHLKREKNNNLILEKVTPENPLPDDFWTMSKDRKGIVESVSAIVGNNGSGKTSLANFLGDCIGYRDIDEGYRYRDKHEKEKKYLVIFKRSTYNFPQYWTNLDPKKLKINCNIRIVDERENPSEKYLPIIYFSPFFTTEHIIKPYRCIDISTSYLLNNLNMGRYKANEYLNALIFLSEYYTKIKNQEIFPQNTQKKNHEIPIELPEPKGIQISINLDNVQRMLYDNILEKVRPTIKERSTIYEELNINRMRIENKKLIRKNKASLLEKIKYLNERISNIVLVELVLLKLFEEIENKGNDVTKEDLLNFNQVFLEIIDKLQKEHEKFANEYEYNLGVNLKLLKNDIIKEESKEKENVLTDKIEKIKKRIDVFIVDIKEYIHENLAKIFVYLFVIEKDDFFLRVFLCFIISFLNQNIVPKEKDTEKQYHILEPCIKIIQIVESSISNVIEFIFDNSLQNMGKLKIIENFITNIKKFISDNLQKKYTKVIESVTNTNYEEVSLFFNSLYAFVYYKKTKVIDGDQYNEKILECKFTDFKAVKDEFYDLVYTYNNIDLMDGFLEFVFSPKMSSGEKSLLTIFSRIYDCINNHQKIKDKKEDIILFFDEVETTLHPEWQRKLVSQIITFLEKFAENKKIHVIFATHSQILLSDIPDSNVVFLKKNKETEYTEVVNHKDACKTFGANIHTLLAKSFFLNKTIGEFASQYIAKTCEMIEEINDISKLTPKRLTTINQRIDRIAEEFIRIGLQRNLLRKMEYLKTSNNKTVFKKAIKVLIQNL